MFLTEDEVLMGSTQLNSTQLNVYLPITENINTTVRHQMAGCQRGLSLFQPKTMIKKSDLSFKAEEKKSTEMISDMFSMLS